jgi:hypothetical protein
VLVRFNHIIWFFLSFLPRAGLNAQVSRTGEEPSGETSPPPDSHPFSDAEFDKGSFGCQHNLLQSLIADSSSKNVLRLSVNRRYVGVDTMCARVTGKSRKLFHAREGDG